MVISKIAGKVTVNDNLQAEIITAQEIKDAVAEIAATHGITLKSDDVVRDKIESIVGFRAAFAIDSLERARITLANIFRGLHDLHNEEQEVVRALIFG
jgi:hypothetical protein